MKKTLIVFLLLILCTSLWAQQSGIRITVTGIKKVKGQLLVAFYNSEDGFLKADKAIYNKVVNVTGNSMDVYFKDITTGSYAIAIIHDANSNGELDTNFLGIPTEHIGTSNNIRNYFGPPSYSESVFVYKGGVFSLSISLY